MCVCLSFLTRTIVCVFICKVAQRLSHSPVLECLHRVAWHESRKVYSGLNLAIHSVGKNGKTDDRVTNRYMPLISVLHLLLVRARKMREVLQEIYLKREKLPSMSRPLSTAGLYIYFFKSVCIKSRTIIPYLHSINFLKVHSRQQERILEQ